MNKLLLSTGMAFAFVAAATTNETEPTETVQVATGAASESIMQILSDMGVYTHESGGSKDTYLTESIAANDLICQVHRGYQYEPPRADTYDCRMTADIKLASGGDSWIEGQTLSVEGELAERLYTTLLSIGLQDDCGMGSCGFMASGVNVQRDWVSEKATTSGCVTTDPYHVKEGVAAGCGQESALRTQP